VGAAGGLVGGASRSGHGGGMAAGASRLLLSPRLRGGHSGCMAAGSSRLLLSPRLHDAGVHPGRRSGGICLWCLAFFHRGRRARSALGVAFGNAGCGASPAGGRCGGASPAGGRCGGGRCGGASPDLKHLLSDCAWAKVPCALPLLFSVPLGRRSRLGVGSHAVAARRRRGRPPPPCAARPRTGRPAQLFISSWRENEIM
jgi:hypothetical protein